MSTLSCSDPLVPVCFDARGLPAPAKYHQILQQWLNLPVGDFFVLLDESDPAPLRIRFAIEFDGAFSWDYLEAEHVYYRVRIQKLIPDLTG